MSRRARNGEGAEGRGSERATLRGGENGDRKVEKVGGFPPPPRLRRTKGKVIAPEVHNIKKVKKVTVKY